MFKKSLSRKAMVTVFSAALLAVFGLGTSEAAFNTDIVGQAAVTSFSAMLDGLEFPPAADDEMGTWVLSDPDGNAAFWWRKSADDMRTYDAFICFDAEPFINAGLDVNKLPAGMKEMLDDRGKIR